MSSEPHFFPRILDAWKGIPFLRSQNEDPLFSPTTITRTRSLISILPQNCRDSGRLPVHVYETYKQKLQSQPKKSPLNLSSKLFCLIICVLGSQSQTMSSTPQNQHSVFGPAMVVAFVAALFAMLVSKSGTTNCSHLRFAAIAEIIGCLAFVLIFMLRVQFFFSGSFYLWVIMLVLAMVFTILAFYIHFSK
ncbi:hypothetical protein VNO78_09439 [Psophocarpus tetragonolobus]|uniref:Uncharacterized protein n=1 Tax=Psophocarpus tetragonolobus TaxID=3891 RepID=A0AAN9T7Y6_PSOTE